MTSSVFWEETLSALPPRYYAIAPDLRGFGNSEAAPVDATRGLRDFSDDLHALLNSVSVISGDSKVHLVGWSMGGGVAMQYAIDYPDRVASLVLVNPLSPYGFGGTKDIAGTPCYSDYAGSGAGLVRKKFIESLILAQYRSIIAPVLRKALHNFLFNPSFTLNPEQENALLSAMLSTRISDDNYPGNVRNSKNWPFFAPGSHGVLNAMSPKYCNLTKLVNATPKPDVLWIHGGKDQTISNESIHDFGYLGSKGIIAGWPGKDIFPQQPMVAQIRMVLKAYEQANGRYREVIIDEAGHCPFIEKPKTFREVLLAFLSNRRP
jgi:pimeloyl-ACP methyl ester carboxylesterase